MKRPKEYKYLKSQTKLFKSFADDRMAYLKPILKVLKPKKILELGCGEGSLGEIMKRTTGAEVFGVDHSTSGIILAKEKKISAKKADLNKEIPFRSHLFDLVISDQLIEHINNTDLLIKESFRVLRKDGFLITITPNLSYWFNRLLFILGIYPIFLEAGLQDKTLGQGFLKRYMSSQEAMGHIRVFNLAALVDLLTYHGLVIRKKQGIPLAFNSVSKLIRIYNMVDRIFAWKTSLARDLMIVAQKP